MGCSGSSKRYEGAPESGVPAESCWTSVYAFQCLRCLDLVFLQGSPGGAIHHWNVPGVVVWHAGAGAGATDTKLGLQIPDPCIVR